MAGRQRTRLGLPKPVCTSPGCKTIPNTGWELCRPHEEREIRRLTATWEQDLDRHATHATISVPDLGKPLADLTRTEEAALGRLICWQLHELETPSPDVELDEAA